MADIRVWTGNLTKPSQICFCVDTDGWVCETHELKGHPHDDCGAAGKPCPMCYAEGTRPMVPPGWRSIASTTDEDR